jgi:hypothetical protein
MTRTVVRLLAGSLLALFTLSAPARAQIGSPVEYGADAALAFMLDPSVVVLSVPVNDVRIGFFMSPRVELEPRFRLVAARGSGDSYTEAVLVLGALFHYSASRAAPQSYLRPFAAVTSVKLSGNDAATATSLGVGLGMKRPIGNRFAFRPELNYAHQFDNDAVGSQDRLELLLGFSVYSH